MSHSAAKQIQNLRRVQKSMRQALEGFKAQWEQSVKILDADEDVMGLTKGKSVKEHIKGMTSDQLKEFRDRLHEIGIKKQKKKEKKKDAKGTKNNKPGGTKGNKKR